MGNLPVAWPGIPLAFRVRWPSAQVHLEALLRPKLSLKASVALPHKIEAVLALVLATGAPCC